MKKLRRRAAYYLFSVSILILVVSVVYDVGMKTFEPGPYPPAGVEWSLAHSMQVVVETFTATGYGSDSPWISTEMNILIVLLDLTGVALFFLALPAILVPLFQNTLSPSAPTAVDDGLSDHIVICTYTARAEVLVEELQSNEVPYVLVEPDDQRALELQEQGHTVVHAEPQSVSDLRRANIGSARALVADVSDRIDASIVLATKEAAESCTVLSVVDEPGHESYHSLAGADEVVMPRKLLGEGLAGKLTTALDTDLGDSLEIGDDFDVMEVPIHHGSPLAGTTLAESNIRERFGVSVIGAWFRGTFESPPPPSRTLDGGTVLLVSGNQTQIETLERELHAPVRSHSRSDVVVIGHGEVGKTVTNALDRTNVPYTVVDQEPGNAVDIVGDATDPDVMIEAGVPNAQSVVLTLPDDTTTEFATLVARDLNEAAEVAARSNSTEAVRKTYRAGADYVLSLSTVSGRAIASVLLEGSETLSQGQAVQILKTTAPVLSGETLATADVREQTGCTVVAVERSETVITELEPQFQFESSDTLVIAGTDEGTNVFIEQYT
ncbi:potassium channel family protein [Halovenus rubra]|uniref:Potassium channel family protein n=2 Tax=Halovenus rubra TaxID=869890 RepID=A0ACC7E0B6_9EURY|nr:NAD-binding protein [Halovenus rubra]